MKDKQPLISICIPTYNGEEYLQDALESVKSQTYKNIEVIISDDNSTDNTLHICEKFKREVDFPVFIFHHKPSGIGANWNHCIDNANGAYIKFLFQDDLLEDDCVEQMLKYILERDLDIVICKRHIITGSMGLSDAEEWINKYGDLQKGISLEFDDFYLFKKDDLYRLGTKNELSYNFIGEPVTALFKTELFHKIGRYSSRLKQVLDLEYYLKILLHTNIGIINKKLISFRVHENQASTINANSKVDEGHIIEQVLYRKFNRSLSLSQKKIIFYHQYPILDRAVRLMYKYKIFR